MWKREVLKHSLGICTDTISITRPIALNQGFHASSQTNAIRPRL